LELPVHHTSTVERTPEEVADWATGFIDIGQRALFRIILEFGSQKYVASQHLWGSCRHDQRQDSEGISRASGAIESDTSHAEYCWLTHCCADCDQQAHFNIENDFVPGEEEEVRRENARCEDF
jgi:hypothetical protein